MKTQVILEMADKQVSDKEITAKVKELWTKDGNKVGDIKTLNTYLKPEEGMVYFVINDSYQGRFAL